jgi:hypothetical protein
MPELFYPASTSLNLDGRLLRGVNPELDEGLRGPAFAGMTNQKVIRDRIYEIIYLVTLMPRSHTITIFPASPAWPVFCRKTEFSDAAAHSTFCTVYC